MIKLIYSHINSKDLTFSAKEFRKLLSQDEITRPENWQPVLVIFGIIKINM